MENFNNPFFDKVVGVPTREKAAMPRVHEHLLDEIKVYSEKIDEFELEKTEKDLELIRFAEESVDRIFAEYGRSKVIPVPLSNIHILKEGGTEGYTEGALIGGGYSSTKKNILVDRNASDLKFSLALFHELAHLKSYSAVQIIANDDGRSSRVESYRSGLQVNSRDGSMAYLKDFEEAIIGYFTKVFYENSIKKDGRFKGEVEEVEKNGDMVDTSREEELERLHGVVDAIFFHNRDAFQTKEEIFNLFVDAQINGNLMKLARVIEKTFGEGSLKKIDTISNN